MFREQIFGEEWVIKILTKMTKILQNIVIVIVKWKKERRKN